MQNSENSIFNRNFLIKTLIGVIIALAVTFIFALLFALLMTALDLNREFSSPFSTVALSFGCFTGAYFTAAKIKNKGLVVGAVLGLCIFMIKVLISLALSSAGFTLISVFHLIACVLSGCIAGILAVNFSFKNKYPK